MAENKQLENPFEKSYKDFKASLENVQKYKEKIMDELNIALVESQKIIRMQSEIILKLQNDLQEEKNKNGKLQECKQ